MSESSPPSTLDAPLLQPRLSHVLTHLQPNLAECVLGTDPSSLRLVHLGLREASPLLIRGHPAMGTQGLAISLLVQLLAMNSPSLLRVVMLDCSGQLASLVRFLPHTCAAATTELDVMQAIPQVNRIAEGARQTGVGSPLVLVVVNEFLGLRSDANAWNAFRALAEHGHERGIVLIALSHAGDNDITSLCRQRIVFASEQPGTAFACGSFEELAATQAPPARQHGQFLFEEAERQGSRQLVLPLIDILALHVDERNEIHFLRRSPSPIGCSGLEALLHTGGEHRAAEFQELLASHVCACLRCRHGLLPLADPLQGAPPLNCRRCSGLLPTYYEATHPDHPRITMPPAELVQVANHLGQCQACCEVWGALVQLSFLEGEGQPTVK